MLRELGDSTYFVGPNYQGGDGYRTTPNFMRTRKCGNCDAFQLEAARRRAVTIRFNFVARAKFEVAQPIRCRLRAFLLLIRYVTL